jgi:hypothetical protein
MTFQLQGSSSHTKPDVVLDLFGEFIVLAFVMRVEFVLLVFRACLLVRIAQSEERKGRTW